MKQSNLNLITWSRDRPRPVLFENGNQRFSLLAKRAAKKYKKVDPTHAKLFVFNKLVNI